MIELEDEIVEREEAFTDDWYMVRKMGRTPTFAEAIHWADTHPNWKRFKDVAPTPLDGEDFLVKVEGIEEDYAYAWYAYDRQCFICYATGLSLPSVTYWMPILLPKED